MARSLEQITKDLSTLETATTRIDESLKTLYKEYLAVLGKAVKQQLVLAVYHLCTQAYPDEFLRLSVSDREKLQAGIRKIAAQGQTQIEQLGEVMDISSLATKLEEAIASHSETVEEEAFESATPPPETAASEEDLSTAASWADENKDPERTSLIEAEADETEADESADETPTSADDDADNIAAASKEASEMIRRLSASLSLFSVFGSEPLSPVSLAKRHVLLERHLRAILHTLSSLANYLLKQTYILPDLPEMVIAAAAEAEAGESGPNNHNLLNVLVEIGSDRDEDEDDDEDDEDDDDDEFQEGDFDEDDTEREMTHLVAINLRLADIEFADTHTALWRNKLQETLLQLKRLGGRYQKLQREKARAEAEHAWRAVWFEH